MSKLNPVLHQELRLSIISYLATVEAADFKKLTEVTGATKGNLSVQISKLQEAKYITVIKTFRNNYPHTDCEITDLGRTEFNTYLKKLKKLLNL